ncbi:orotidine 5'-phosphate decarboxylase [Actinomycetes bacterium]|nr:orotidine 5'-phosphate decarboxylase [Actinomycetes bacterium]
MGFSTRLHRAWERSNSLVCVGLDPDPRRFPSPLGISVDDIETFCRTIVDATADSVCAFKPQIAYFAAHSAERALERVCDHVRREHPDAVLILDAKRGDIGDTAEMYAREAFERYGADAVTVNPFLGTDSLEPFFARRDRGVIVLCRTSNPGSHEVQNALVVRDDDDGNNVAGTEPLYERIARRAATDWSQRADVGLVVGATQPTELKRVRDIVGDLPLLVPGVGAQGGDPATVMQHGATARGTGLIVNSSRAILYASSNDDYAVAARRATVGLRDALNAARR